METWRNARTRARAVLEGWRDHPGVVQTRHGEVRIADIRPLLQDGVEVFLGGATETGETHFRVFNPPTRTLAGEIDPVHALAEAIARHGGARKRRPR